MHTPLIIFLAAQASDYDAVISDAMNAIRLLIALAVLGAARSLASAMRNNRSRGSSGKSQT